MGWSGLETIDHPRVDPGVKQLRARIADLEAQVARKNALLMKMAEFLEREAQDIQDDDMRDDYEELVAEAKKEAAK